MRSIVLALVLALPAGSAAAQACEEGRVSSPATAGRCCWPGQSWSEAHARCSGPPTCPEALVAHADDCVPRMVRVPAAPPGYAPMVEDFDGVPPPDPAISASIAPATSSSIAPATSSSIPQRPEALPVPPTAPARVPVTETAWPPTPPDLELSLFAPRLERGTDDGLLIAGLLIFAGGYLVGILGGVADESAQNCSVFSPGFTFMTVSCGTWAYAFIPVAGGIASGTVQVSTDPGFTASNRNPAVGLGVGIPAAVIQLGGIVFTVLALAGHIDRAVSTGRPEGIEISFAPWADETGGGAWLDVRF